MSDQELEAQRAVEALDPLMVRTRFGTLPSVLHLGEVLAELDEWLADENQWAHAGARHWRSLLHELEERVRFLACMSEGPLQTSLMAVAADLKKVSGAFSITGDGPDEALRRSTLRLATTLRTIVLSEELLSTAFRRIQTWVTADPELSERGVGVLRNLAALQGHDEGPLMDRIGSILHDNPVGISAARGEPVPADRRSPAGTSALERLELVESLLMRPPQRRRGVIWLEYLQAQLGAPWVLPIGPSVTLFAHHFLRSMVNQAPSDSRIPYELKQDADSRSFLTGWLGAAEAAQAVRADHEVHGDPRVFVRIELEEMPSTQLLRVARETAEFLVAYGALGSENHELWVLGDSYHVVDGISSNAWVPVNVEGARDQLPYDPTGANLARDAERLAKHLPLRDHNVRVAGRLLIWLRDATRNDNPARLVLCDRVVEQTAGWAGVSRPSRFVTDFLKPFWMYEQVRRAVYDAYLQLTNDTRGSHALAATIEEQAPRPPFSVADHLPRVNLKAALENIEGLVDVSPPGSAARVTLARLRERLASKASVRSWLDDLDKQFEIRNDRLRRTRNALMHGGPLVRPTVDNAASFAETLAYQAIWPAIDLMLDERDIVEGFLDRQRDHNLSLTRLRDGRPASEALFWG